MTKPRQAMSARQVDRVEKEVVKIKRRLGNLRIDIDHALIAFNASLTRLLASVRRSERR